MSRLRSQLRSKAIILRAKHKPLLCDLATYKAICSQVSPFRRDIWIFRNPNTAWCHAKFCPTSVPFRIPACIFFSKPFIAGASPGSWFSAVVVLVVGAGVVALVVGACAENPICRRLRAFYAAAFNSRCCRAERRWDCLVWAGPLTYFKCSVFFSGHAVGCFEDLINRSNASPIYQLVGLYRQQS